MTAPHSRLLAVAVDAADPHALAAFWAAALGADVSELWTDAHGTTYVAVPLSDGTELLFQPVDDERVGKNRAHLDLAAVGTTRDAEVDRLVGMGARVLDLAPDHPWIVMADPEGNEFCVLDPR